MEELVFPTLLSMQNPVQGSICTFTLKTEREQQENIMQNLNYWYVLFAKCPTSNRDVISDSEEHSGQLSWAYIF